jgi:hypothetical protein
MSARGAHGRRRLHELLADRATQALTARQLQELSSLLRRHPKFDGLAYDRAAAAVALTRPPASTEPIPAELRRRIADDAIAWRRRARAGRR